MAMSTTKTVPMPSLMRRTVSTRNRSVAAARRAATDPTMTATATIDCDVQATDLSCSVIANRIRGKSNSVIAKVTNCSQLPLLATQTVTAGLYASAADTEPSAARRRSASPSAVSMRTVLLSQRSSVCRLITWRPIRRLSSR